MAITATHESTQKLFALLKEEFGLPEGSYSVTVRLEVGSPVTIDVGYFPEGKQDDADRGTKPEDMAPSIQSQLEAVNRFLG